jgi:Domain of unknown function (DUF6924)
MASRWRSARRGAATARVWWKVNHTAAQCWWRTLADDVTVEQAQASVDRFTRVRGDTLVDRGYFFVADTRTIADPEHPILVVNNEDPFDDDDPELTVPCGATFRVIPSHIVDPEANLSLANMDFVEFADATDDDGVFRGFR